MRSVRLPNGSADVLLLASGPSKTSAWDEYIAALRHFRGFAPQMSALDRLADLSAVPVIDRRDVPQVGILVNEPSQLLPGADGNLARLVRSVSDLGCRPMLIGPCPSAALPQRLRRGAPHALGASLDAVIGLGGSDVAPSLYGETNRHAQHVHLERDESEAEIARACFDLPLFMLGICRSHQLWNVAAGGALVQDLQAQGYTRFSRRQRDYGIDLDDAFVLRRARGSSRLDNRVHAKAGTTLAGELGLAFLVNASHHQAVRRAGRNFQVVAAALGAPDERSFIASTERWNGLTVQFHPEARKQGAPERRLLELLGRRAHIAHLFRNLRQQGAPPGTLVAELSSLRAPRFRQSDLDWARQLETAA